jgi:hypothetical protein
MTEVVRNECPKCHTEFQSARNCAYHIHHDVCSNKSFRCDDCNKQYTLSRNLRRHACRVKIRDALIKVRREVRRYDKKLSKSKVPSSDEIKMVQKLLGNGAQYTSKAICTIAKDLTWMEQAEHDTDSEDSLDSEASDEGGDTDFDDEDERSALTSMYGDFEDDDDNDDNDDNVEDEDANHNNSKKAKISEVDEVTQEEQLAILHGYGDAYGGQLDQTHTAEWKEWAESLEKKLDERGGPYISSDDEYEYAAYEEVGEEETTDQTLGTVSLTHIPLSHNNVDGAKDPHHDGIHNGIHNGIHDGNGNVDTAKDLDAHKDDKKEPEKSSNPFKDSNEMYAQNIIIPSKKQKHYYESDNSDDEQGYVMEMDDSDEGETTDNEGKEVFVLTKDDLKRQKEGWIPSFEYKGQSLSKIIELLNITAEEEKRTGKYLMHPISIKKSLCDVDEENINLEDCVLEVPVIAKGHYINTVHALMRNTDMYKTLMYVKNLATANDYLEADFRLIKRIYLDGRKKSEMPIKVTDIRRYKIEFLNENKEWLQDYKGTKLGKILCDNLINTYTLCNIKLTNVITELNNKAEKIQLLENYQIHKGQSHIQKLTDAKTQTKLSKRITEFIYSLSEDEIV